MHDKNIVLKKADKGTTTVIMNRKDKLNEGQVQLDDIHNYRPLDKPIVSTMTKKVHRLIQSLLQEGHTDEMTAKWLSLTPDPPRIPVFYTLTKIHKPAPVGRPIISGGDGPTERISAFADHLIQPIAQKQASYPKDTTDFLNFIEKTKLPKDIIIPSLSQWTSPVSTWTYHRRRVLPLYAKHTKNFNYERKPPIPTMYLREMQRLILQENLFQFSGKDYLQTHGTAMGTKMAHSFR